VCNFCVSVTFLTINFSNFFLLIILIIKLCNKDMVQCGKLVGPADMGLLVSVCNLMVIRHETVLQRIYFCSVCGTVGVCLQVRKNREFRKNLLHLLVENSLLCMMKLSGIAQ
jgi:hypothetical protein